MSEQVSYHDRLARQITERLGGAQNIISVTHCTTRLRFKLKRIPVEAIEAINKLPDVISVLNSGGMFQIVIGTQVEKLYQSITPLLETDQSKNFSGRISSILNTIINIFTPILWLLSAAGILKGIILLLVNIGWIAADSGTHRIFLSAADGVFFYLPMLLGYTSAKHFGSDPLFGIAIAGALIHPEITQHVNWIFSQYVIGQEVPTEYFLGLPIEYLNYSASVIPILFATWFNVRLEQLIPRSIPEVVCKMIKPLLCLIVTVPVTFLVIGPLSTTFAKLAAAAIFTLYHASPELAGILVGSLWQVLVVFGIHWCLFPIAISNIAMHGYDVVPPLLIPAIFGQLGSCLGVLIKNLHNQKIRGYAGSAAITAMFGVTEPAIYGVTLPRKWPFVYGCVAAAIGSCIVASFHAKSYSLGVLNLFSFIQIIPPSGYDESVTATILATLLTIILALTLTYFFTPEVDQELADCVTKGKTPQIDKEVTPRNRQALLQVFSPLKGEVVSLSKVADPTFASEIMGQGIAIRPEVGILRAPFNGRVESIFKTHHSIGLVSDQGIEALIHIGLDTVKLQGSGFELLVNAGDQIETGQVLIKFDIDFIIDMGFDTTTPIIITNCDDYLDIIATNSLTTESGEPLLTLL